MRIVILFVLVIASIAVKAQTPLSLGFMDYMQRTSIGTNIHSIPGTPNKKWFVSTYSAISARYNFFNGSLATVVGVPLGLQLNRRLNNNLYAFAGVSVTPAYINFNHSFLSSDLNKSYQNNGLFKSNSFGMYSRAEMGLMYVNDARTFSVSGSIGVERSGYPMIPYPPVSNARPNPVTRPNK